MKRFRQDIKKLSSSNDLPDYEVLFDPITDKVTFKNRNQNTPQAETSRKREKGKREVYKIKKRLSQNN